MPNFETINEEIDNLNKDIERARFETEFVQSVEKKYELKIKPIYLVFLLITAFFVELATAINKRGYEPTIWLYCAVGAVLLIYVVYVSITLLKRRQAQKEANEQAESKGLVYETLLNKRKDFFEKFVAETKGIVMISAENNLSNYIWVENEVLTIATLEKELKREEIPLEDVKYISSDDRLFDYNKFLGNATNVAAETQNAYIFTKEKCFVFHTLNYDCLAELMPEKELLNVLMSKS